MRIAMKWRLSFTLPAVVLWAAVILLSCLSSGVLGDDGFPPAMSGGAQVRISYESTPSWARAWISSIACAPGAPKCLHKAHLWKASGAPLPSSLRGFGLSPHTAREFRRRTRQTRPRRPSS